MNLKKLLLTNNECYKIAKKHVVKGIMIHSTGANNPNLGRYVGPDDGYLNSGNNHWNVFRPDGRQVCVHAFIGKLKDGTIAAYQTLPWDMIGWHSGSGAKGSANFMGYIGFEICEDNLTDRIYFDKVYKEAVELCVYLCEQYKLNPITDIICHSEGYTRGIASNHADVMHWFPKHGKNMDEFRQDVKRELNKNNSREDEDMSEKIYNTVNDLPEWAKTTIEKLINKGILNGTGQGLNINETMLRILVINDRAGLYK